MAVVWIETEQCTGCGACVTTCPNNAITLKTGKAYVDTALCKGCEVCVEVCPTHAIQAVMEGEIIPSTAQPPAASEPITALASLREAAISAVIMAGTELTRRAVHAIAQNVGQWLFSQKSNLTNLRSNTPNTPTRTSTTEWTGRGYGRQHRQRGHGRR